jgi:hypothetical protein
MCLSQTLNICGDIGGGESMEEKKGKASWEKKDIKEKK